MNIPTPLLEVRDLRIATTAPDGSVRELVHGVSLTVHPGEVLCLVGESGSGKSLTMLAVLGLLPPGVEVTGGQILVDGIDVAGMDDNELRVLRGGRVGMVFQDPMTALNPVKRVGNQVARAVKVHQPTLSTAHTRVRAAELLERVGVRDAAERARAYPHQWSGGMRQRAVIAMAIANNPGLLIADEPTTALDVTVQAQIMRVLAEARRDTGAALVMITHDLGLVAQVADRICIMRSGEIVEEGSVWDIFDRPDHPYTRMLLSSILGVPTTNPEGVSA
ncbi:ABC-type dipeptide/oligopeptide/nickel transport system ATPase component [Mycetocola sp. BIGb0189]|uniref:ABC transporter ATP-binding protein n=1 Tax=Mycetocola sp. BIGb0189 TaxID=2940604 RepID=UPI00216A45EB|nr:ABC transporter ATP-binding protein [Mycetocola sp. BIGb0189]MCS4277550.1 ABC-type dipeptide/oligopeptide/nickel transport system ATPase component [Mycetocola sp. BIGb0189]